MVAGSNLLKIYIFITHLSFMSLSLLLSFPSLCKITWRITWPWKSIIDLKNLARKTVLTSLFCVSIDNRHDNTIALYYYPIAHGEKCDYSDIEIVLLGFWTDIRPTDRRPAIENLDLEDSTLKKMYNG